MLNGTTQNLLFCGVSALSVSSVWLGTPAVAQDENSESIATERTGDTIVVTAQKREQSAQDVGITLNVFSDEDLRELNVTGVQKVSFITPGVSLSGSAAGQTVSFAIRGVTQQDFAPIAEPPNAIYLDEGYFAGNSITGIGFFDIERVEVLKGPQGTLFGRNATGGLVSVTTRKPTDEFEGYLSGMGGSYGTAEAEAAISGPLTDLIQARLSGVYRRNGGWLDNRNPNGSDLGQIEKFGVRLHIAAQPLENIEILASGYYNDLSQSWGPYTAEPSASTLINGVPGASFTPGPSLLGTFASDIENLVINSDTASSDGGFNRVGGGTFKIDWDAGWADIVSITDYKTFENQILVDNDAETGIAFIDTGAGTDVETFSQELRFLKQFEKGNISGGFYYLNIDASGVGQAALYSAGLLALDLTELETDSYSVFGQGEFEIAPSLSFVGGFRATREVKDYTYESLGFPSLAVGPPAGTPDFSRPVGVTPLPLRDFTGEYRDWLYSWKAQLDYKPTDNLLIFGGYNRGTKAGSFNAPFAGGAIPADPDVPYDAEKLDAYEVGAKYSSHDGLWRLNGSLFYYDYTDYQSFALIGLSTVVTNQPAEIIGVEVDFDWTPIENFLVKGGATFIDAEIEDVAFGNLLGSTVANRRPPFTAEWEAFALAQYTHALNGGAGSITAQLSGSYATESFFSVTNFDVSRIDPHGVLGARISWLSDSENLEVFVQGENLTDERYQTVGFDLSDFGGLTEVSYARPRWITGGVRVTF